MTVANNPNAPGGEQSSTDAAKQAGQDVGRDAGQQAQAVAGTAKQEAGQVIDEAKGRMADLASTARQQLHSQAKQQTDHLGESIGQLGGHMHALADGRPEEAGPAADYVHRLAGQADRVASQVDELGFDGMIHQAQRFARRRPGMFLLGAATAGFAMSRLGRGARDAQQDGSGASSQADGRPQSQQLAGATEASSRESGVPTGTEGASRAGVPEFTRQPSGANSVPPPPASGAQGGQGDRGHR